MASRPFGRRSGRPAKRRLRADFTGRGRQFRFRLRDRRRFPAKPTSISDAGAIVRTGTGALAAHGGSATCCSARRERLYRRHSRRRVHRDYQYRRASCPFPRRRQYRDHRGRQRDRRARDRSGRHVEPTISAEHSGDAATWGMDFGTVPMERRRSGRRQRHSSMPAATRSSSPPPSRIAARCTPNGLTPDRAGRRQSHREYRQAIWAADSST